MIFRMKVWSWNGIKKQRNKSGDGVDQIQWSVFSSRHLLMCFCILHFPTLMLINMADERKSHMTDRQKEW